MLYRIYGLYEPSGTLRYIGITRKSLATRLRQHLRGDFCTPAKSAWLADLKAKGLRPVIREIETLTGSPQDARNREHQLLIWELYKGTTLLNKQTLAMLVVLDEINGTGIYPADEREAFRRIAMASHAISLEPASK